MCPRLKQSSLTRSTGRSEHWQLGCCLLLRRHLRYRCHMPMPASSVGRSWGPETPQAHAGTAGCVLPGSSAWLARAPVTPEGQAVTNPRVERGTLCPGGGRDSRFTLCYELGDGRQQVATLCYKPRPLVRSSRWRWLRGTVSSSRTPGLAGVQEQSFCRVRGSSQGYHVSVGLQLWAVGLALAIMPGDLGVYARRPRVHTQRWVRCLGGAPGQAQSLS